LLKTELNIYREKKRLSQGLALQDFFEFFPGPPCTHCSKMKVSGKIYAMQRENRGMKTNFI